MRGVQRGFTLIEVLVALSVAALLVSLVYGAVRVGQRSVHALDTQASQAEVMRLGWQFLHDAVAHARPGITPGQTASRTGFIGSSDTLTFVADMPSYVGSGGPMRINLGMHTTADGDQLLLSRERLDAQAASTSGDGIQQAVLVDRLDSLEIGYFGRIERGADPGWSSYWNNPRNLPNLVRIAVKPRDAAAWPVLIARPMKGAAAMDESAQPDEAEASDESLEADP